MIGRRLGLIAKLSLVGMLVCARPGAADQTCPAARPTLLLPTDPDVCRKLQKEVRDPSALPLDVYEMKLGDYLRNFCHRDADAGWRSDKSVRDTGPFTASLVDGGRASTSARMRRS